MSPTHVDLRALQEDEVDRIERSDDRQTRLDERMSPRIAADHDTREVLVIEPKRSRGLAAAFDRSFLREVSRQRELLYFLIWRDIKVRYKMAALGLAWALMVPLVSTIIFGVIGTKLGFGNGQPAPWIMVLAAGMTPWLFIQKCVSDGGQSLVHNQQLLSKIYMPRVFIPSASCGTAMVDMLTAFLITSGFAVIFTITGSWTPTWNVLAIPLLVPLTFVAGVGTAILLSGITVLYRDVRFLIPFFTQFGLWLSAVVFPLELVLPENYLWIAAINPYAGIVSAWRSAIIGTEWQPLLVASSCVLSPIILLVGVAYFRHVERRFADIA
ncbi:MAG: ABC transporter permease [Planctomycetota bacterium]